MEITAHITQLQFSQNGPKVAFQYCTAIIVVERQNQTEPYCTVITLVHNQIDIAYSSVHSFSLYVPYFRNQLKTTPPTVSQVHKPTMDY